MYEFKINNVVFPTPKNFSPERVDNIIASYVTLAGNIVSDKRGWRYGDTTLEWAYLETSQVQWLLNQTNTAFTITFVDIDGVERITKAMRTTSIANKALRYINKLPCFTDINMGVTFIDVTV